MSKLKEKIIREVRIKPTVAGILAPTRSENLPPKGANIIEVRATGKINMPTLEGENPKMFWKKKGMTKVCAPLIQKERKLAPRPKIKSRFRKREKSTRGDEDRSSVAKNRPKQKRVIRSHPQRRGVDPCPTRLRKKRRKETERNSVRAPKRSIWTFLAGPSFGKTFRVRKIPIAPMGRLI